MVILRAHGEAVVGGERMRGDAQVADTRVVGKRDVEGPAEGTYQVTASRVPSAMGT